MARYIDAENMYKEVWKRSTSSLNEWDTWGVLNVLDMVKTEDVAPVVHAHWIDTLYGWRCSNCKKEQEYTLYFKHGPNCGSKMDEEVL